MRIRLLIIPVIGIMLSGCPQSINQGQKDIEKNNLNLPNPRIVHELGIRFELSELLEESYYNNFTLKSHNSVTYSADDVTLHLSVEQYNSSELVSIQYQNEIEGQPDLEALRDFYAKKRHLSIAQSIVSEPSELYSKTGKKGWIQSIEDASNGDNYDLHYLIATIHFKGSYYVFQFMAGKETMPYLYDDFLAMIKSVK